MVLIDQGGGDLLTRQPELTGSSTSDEGGFGPRFGDGGIGGQHGNG